MLKELFDAICTTAAKADGPNVVELQRKMLIQTADGWREEPKLSENDPVSIEVGTVEDLATAIKDNRPIAAARVRHTELSGAEEVPPHVTSVFVRPGTIVAVLDMRTQNDTVSVRLVDTQLFSILSSKFCRTFTKRDIIRFIRTELHGTGAERHLGAFRNIIFERTNSAGGSLKHGDESLGRSIEQRVSTQSSDLIPEVLELQVPVYLNDGLQDTFPITLNVDVIYEQEQIQVSAIPDQVDRVRVAAVKMVAVRVEKALTDTEVENASVFVSARLRCS